MGDIMVDCAHLLKIVPLSSMFALFVLFFCLNISLVIFILFDCLNICWSVSLLFVCLFVVWFLVIRKTGRASQKLKINWPLFKRTNRQ